MHAGSHRAPGAATPLHRRSGQSHESTEPEQKRQRRQQIQCLELGIDVSIILFFFHFYFESSQKLAHSPTKLTNKIKRW